MRILLVDSSEVFRMGMRALLADARELVVAGEAPDAEAALVALRAHAPDLVITDLELPDGTGLKLAATVRELAPATRVLVLASTASEVGLRQAGAAGVGGYLLKSEAPRTILAAVLDVAAGRPIAPPPTREVGAGATSGHANVENVDDELPRAARAAVLDRLSTREREIFNLIIWGQTNKQVAVKLGISVKTVETHRSHINGKLQVHSAAELVRLASLCGALAAGSAGDAADTSSISTSPSPRDRPPGKVAVDRPPPPRLIAKIG